jgi:hypothetical protein
MTKQQTGLGAILGYAGSNADDIQAVKQRDADLMDLFSVMPDPGQPRNLLPSDLYKQLWAGGQPTEILQTWLQRTAEGDVSPAQRQAVEELKQLAATIEVHGLIHPINVRDAQEAKGIDVPRNVTRLVVTGERRWWAHVLLVVDRKQIAGERSPRQIQAILLPPGAKVRALQLIENMQRAGLSAVERAEGLEELRQELSEGRSNPVPWVEVERTLGINKVYRWRIQQVLNLSHEAIDLIRWHGLTEKAIRPISEKLQDRPELQIVALTQLISWQETSEDAGNKRLLDLINRLLRVSVENQVEAATAPDPIYLTRTFSRRARTALKLISDLDNETIEQVAQAVAEDKKTIASLTQLRDKLNAILGS